MATIDNLTLEITANTSKAVTDIEKLATALSALKQATQIRPSNIGKLADNFEKLRTSCSSLNMATVHRVERLANALEKISSVSSIKGFGSSISKAMKQANKLVPVSGTTQVGSSTADIVKQTKNATKGRSNFWTKYQTVKNMIKSNPISLLASAEDTKKMTDLSETLGLSVGAVTTLSKALGVAGIVFTVVSKAVSIFTNAIKKVLDPIKNFVRALGRIALYRALRGILKSISQGLKEGIQNLALYSKAMEGLDSHNANNIMSRYASAFLYFKNAIATAVIPVLHALIPIIETVINRIVDLINVISQIGSAFFGTQFTKAKYFWVDYADSLLTASDASKKAHHELAKFDELNNLTPQKGGTDKLGDALQMFEESKINEKLQSIADTIKNTITDVKEILAPLGQIVDKAKEFFSLTWDKVSPNLKRIYDNLKKIWNDVLKPFLKGFVDGFVSGFLMDGGEFKTLPDFIAGLTNRVALFTDVVTKLFEKIDPDKIEKLGKALGVVFGWFTNLISTTALIGIELVNFTDRVEKLTAYIKREFFPKLQEWLDKNPMLEKSLKLVSSALDNVGIKFFADSVDFAKDVVIKLKDGITALKDKLATLKTSTQGTNPFATLKTYADSAKTVVDALKKALDSLASMKISIPVLISASTSGLGSVASTITNTITNAVEKGIEAVKPVVTTTTTTSSSSSGQYGGYNTVTEYINAQKKRASGGYVPNGDLFIANEKGAEFVGAIGGNTAVANNNQITEAIAQATYVAMSKALSENGGSVNIVVEGDSDKMFKVFQKKQREYNRDTGFAY